ncbi:MAG TPA: carboxylesterase family protein, partial [Geobacteraceae bacterium]|nr:carboxylesterase family protein [Geobacteraceae bacterium]
FMDFEQHFYTLPAAEAIVAAFYGDFGCSSQTSECLRSLPDSVFIHGQPGMLYPVLDGNVLVQPPGPAIAGGQFNRVPVITGTNHDECRFNIVLQYDYLGNPLKDTDYQAAVAANSSLSVDDPLVQFLMYVLYPLSNYPPPPGVQSAPLALGALMTDAGQACPGRNAARFLSQYVPTYMYEFNDENAPLIGGLIPASLPLGAYHSAEIQYLFNQQGIPAFTADQQQLSDAMIAYWTRFAAKGNPNGPDTPVWLPYNAQTDQVQSLVPPTPTVKYNFDADHKCTSFWNTL